MTLDEAIVRLAVVLRAENDALAEADATAAARLLPEKLAAVEAVRGAMPGPLPTLSNAARLRGLVEENGRRLALAIEVQSRILELVARAARAAAPGPLLYGRGATAQGRGGVAFAVRA